MTEEITTLIEEVAATWSQVRPPNRPGVIMAGQMAKTVAGFAAEQGRMAFEDEPSGFETALQATKEGTE
ncbi:MAG: hypothetical protein CML66_18745 [Rhodobacteraceae bacterium]|nr:hypothetical protein [Paracoccaceae bacterium]|tara:strand:+ start:80 stop:286 length:207 start_codon:yes stop_codon:yes gene_type:complete